VHEHGGTRRRDSGREPNEHVLVLARIACSQSIGDSASSHPQGKRENGVAILRAKAPWRLIATIIGKGIMMA
jgi:hypothetical protein